MDLYHFTHQPAILRILADGHILASTAALPPVGHQIERFGVHLTSDLAPEGHGLPDGRQVNEGQARLLRHVEKRGDKMYCLNHREYRLRVSLPEDNPELVRFLALPDMTPLFAFAADAAGHVPVPSNDKVKHADEMQAVQQLLQKQPALRKSGTWWIYKANLPLGFVSHVAYRLSDGTYDEGTLEEFRIAMKSV